MSHTFVIDGRKRLQISKSKTEPGKVLVQILDSARDVLASCSMDAPTAAIVAQAFEIEAVAAEGAPGCCTTPRPDCMGMLVPSIGNNCMAMRDDLRARKAIGQIQRAMISPYADNGGAPDLRALPVVDVAQVGA